MFVLSITLLINFVINLEISILIHITSMFEPTYNFPKGKFPVFFFFFSVPTFGRGILKNAPERAPLLAKRLLCKQLEELFCWEGAYNWQWRHFSKRGKNVSTGCYISDRVHHYGIPYLRPPFAFKLRRAPYVSVPSPNYQRYLYLFLVCSLSPSLSLSLSLSLSVVN